MWIGTVHGVLVVVVCCCFGRSGVLCLYDNGRKQTKKSPSVPQQNDKRDVATRAIVIIITAIVVTAVLTAVVGAEFLTFNPIPDGATGTFCANPIRRRS